MITPHDTKDRFYVIVYCKPQVRKYIYNKCGDPADLTFLQPVNEMFHLLLSNTKMEDKICEDRQKRGDRRYDQFCRVNKEDPPYGDTMNVCINKKSFYRNGFYLNARAVIIFNKFVDAFIKDDAIKYVKSNINLSGNVSGAIRQFQDHMGFTEQELSFECIRKHLQRSGIKIDPNIKDSFVDLFNRSFETNLTKKPATMLPYVKKC